MANVSPMEEQWLEDQVEEVVDKVHIISRVLVDNGKTQTYVEEVEMSLLSTLLAPFVTDSDAGALSIELDNLRQRTAVKMENDQVAKSSDTKCVEMDDGFICGVPTATNDSEYEYSYEEDEEDTELMVDATTDSVAKKPLVASQEEPPIGDLEAFCECDGCVPNRKIKTNKEYEGRRKGEPKRSADQWSRVWPTQGDN